MVTRNVLLGTVLAGMSTALVATRAPALKSTGSAVQLVAVMPETLGLRPLAPTVGLVQGGGAGWGEQPITITTSWNLERSRTKVVVNAYFEDSNGTTIALGGLSSSISGDPGEKAGKGAAGAMFVTPWSGIGGWAKPLEVFEQRLTPGVNDMSSRTDPIGFLTDLTHRQNMRGSSHDSVLTLVVEAY